MDPNRPGREAVGEQLEKILRSDGFKASEKLSGFLRYIVEETLAGRSGQLKAYTIAVEVFGREPDFDPQINPAIRVEAGRLRAKLEHYYIRAQDDPVRINVPKGTYVPTFSFAPERNAVAKDDPAARAPAAVRAAEQAVDVATQLVDLSPLLGGLLLEHRTLERHGQAFGERFQLVEVLH